VWRSRTGRTIGLSVQRDRAPLFVRLADGGVRNGYTVRIVNKTAHAADFELTVTGLPSGRIAVAEDTSGPKDRVALAVPVDDVATFRVLVTAPASLTTGSQPVDFNLRDPVSGETTVYHSSFMGPESGY
jgi:polyferredoxin